MQPPDSTAAEPQLLDPAPSRPGSRDGGAQLYEWHDSSSAFGRRGHGPASAAAQAGDARCHCHPGSSSQSPERTRTDGEGAGPVPSPLFPLPHLGLAGS
ncbi:hypothetical protein NUW54_g11252 [Trametes sanguinea]|uniref:Uncharacterized protein n=1 Tax=Trametes sanguinea TaxID=158606 RepID=A0ACC1NH53_9APHY|nr:hypothetical protein NUW54_g11252 [Trametes sanguinea]